MKTKNLLKNPLPLYLAAALLGLISGCYGDGHMHQLAVLIADMFIHVFRSLGAPIVAVSLITTLASFSQEHISTVGKKTLFYTLGTTFVAALTSLVLYLLIHPQTTNALPHPLTADVLQNASYLENLANVIPVNFLSPFIENQVISILLIGIAVGFATRYIPDPDAKHTVIQFFKGLQSILFVLTQWVVKILPIGIYGFVAVFMMQVRDGFKIESLGQYFLVIVLANLVQGLIILPIWLKTKGIKPFDTMKKMMPALSVAFFSKSSSGTLPLTIKTVENNLGLNTTISRFVLPLCTTINMNGCAAFIFTTVVYVMQCHGVTFSGGTLLLWAIIATVTAVGNAGVPMGCFFLSASLLTNMNIPIELLGLILPVYSLIDMLETALNVWSDSCVASVVNQTLQQADSTTAPVAESA
jgi:Na+/H+-dicarboxylate symporter